MYTWLREEEIADHAKDMLASCHGDGSASPTRFGTTSWARTVFFAIVPDVILSMIDEHLPREITNRRKGWMIT